MNDVTVFDNSEFGTIRTLDISGQPYWVATDVTKALGYKKNDDAIKRHCYDPVKRGITDSLGREQDTYIIPESDLYRLIVHSKLPSAKRFEKWVFEEVLPTLRKQGSYNIQPRQESEQLKQLQQEVQELREAVTGLMKQPEPFPELEQQPSFDRRGDLINYTLNMLCELLNLTTNETLSRIYHTMQRDYGINPNAIRQDYIRTHGGLEVSAFKAVCSNYKAAEVLTEIIVKSINYQLRPAYTLYGQF